MIEAGVGDAGNAGRRLQWHDLRDAGQAQLALLRALVRVRTKPVGALVSPAIGRPALSDTLDVSAARRSLSAVERIVRRAAVQRLELAIARATRRGLFRPTCLVRSLALADMLARHGVAGAEIHIGVRHSGGNVAPHAASGARLEAHAWVELDGTVLGDDFRRAHSFTPLGGVRVVQQHTDGGR